MTKEEFLALVRRYGNECATGGSSTLLPEITTAVDAHWRDMAGVKIGTCTRPPEGWFCTKDAGHTGPCPTWPSADAAQFEPVTDPGLLERTRARVGDDGTNRCPVEHNPGVWPYVSRCVRDRGHHKPWGRAPAFFMGGDVKVESQEVGMLAEDEHMDTGGRIWK